jgi:hypothetical protein
MTPIERAMRERAGLVRAIREAARILDPYADEAALLVAARNLGVLAVRVDRLTSTIEALRKGAS